MTFGVGTRDDGWGGGGKGGRAGDDAVHKWCPPHSIFSGVPGSVLHGVLTMRHMHPIARATVWLPAHPPTHPHPPTYTGRL